MINIFHSTAAVYAVGPHNTPHLTQLLNGALNGWCRGEMSVYLSYQNNTIWSYEASDVNICIVFFLFRYFFQWQEQVKMTHCHVINLKSRMTQPSDNTYNVYSFPCCSETGTGIWLRLWLYIFMFICCLFIQCPTSKAYCTMLYMVQYSTRGFPQNAIWPFIAFKFNSNSSKGKVKYIKSLHPNQYFCEYILSESIIFMLGTITQEISLSVNTISMLVTITQEICLC